MIPTLQMKIRNKQKNRKNTRRITIFSSFPFFWYSMHHGGIDPPYKTKHGETVPPFKMHQGGTIPPAKMSFGEKNIFWVSEASQKQHGLSLSLIEVCLPIMSVSGSRNWSIMSVSGWSTRNWRFMSVSDVFHWSLDPEDFRPETDNFCQFLDPETDNLRQFVGPDTDP